MYWTDFRNLFTTSDHFGCKWCICTLFLPREVMLSAVFAVVVCLCVCLSVTLRYCIKTAKRRITQTTPHDSPMTLVFWRQRSWRNSNGITPYGCDKCRWGFKIGHFRRKTRYNSKTVQDRRIGCVSYIRISLRYFCFRWKTVSLVQASMQHLMHHVMVRLRYKLT